MSKSWQHRSGVPVDPPPADSAGAAPERNPAWRGLLSGVLRDRRASAFVMMAIGMLALATATGVGVDFARGLNFKQALQGAVDSAAIAGASVYLNNGYASQASTAATNYMKSAIPHLPANNGVSSTVSVSSTAPWTVTVGASATINSTFSGLFESTIPVSVSATANGPSNPNINFYMLLDSSPSMAIAATQAGINTMVANTSSQGGCAFACHETHPSSDSLGNPHGEDNYALARALGVTLRIDNLRTAVQNLMSTAQTTSNSNSATYGVAIYTFDVAFNTIQTLTTNLKAAETSAGNIQMLEVYANNWLTSSNMNSDEDTNYDNAMSSINAIMPDPGYGTNASGDTPQEVLFFVTDGVEDQYENPALNPTSGTPGRQQYLMNSNFDWCSQIKNRGIRIAVLYTTYYPLPTNGWYVNFDGSGNGIASFQTQIGPQLQACASPGLFFQVDTGGDISGALAALFTSAVQSAYISQ